MRWPAVVSAIIDSFLEQLVPSDVDTGVDHLRRELRVVDTKIQHLTSAVEQGGANIPSIIALLAERQQERDALVAAIGSAETLHQIHVDRAAIEAKVQRGLPIGVVDEQVGRRRAAAATGSAESARCDSRLTADVSLTAPVAMGELIADAVLPTKGVRPPVEPL